jgi:serine/threonine protein kinase
VFENRIAIKLADMGCACEQDGAKHVSVVGSPSYRSPELYLGGAYDFATDIWSLGCTIAEVGRKGKCIFPTMQNTVLGMISRIGVPSKECLRRISSNYFFKQAGYDRFRRIRHLEPSKPLAFNFSADFENLIKSMLRWDPKQRPTAESLQNHVFFRHSNK